MPDHTAPAPSGSGITAPTQQAMHGSSVQIRLVVMAAAAILPLLILFVGVAVLDYRAERARAGQRQLDLARSMAATVERELHGATIGLQALALSPRLQEPDLESFHGLALRYISTQPPDSELILLDRSGHHLVDTLIPPGAPLPQRAPDVNQALTEQVFQTAQPIVSNLIAPAPGSGPVPGSAIITTDVPVLRDGHVIYDLSLVQPAARFTAILAAQHLPDDTVAAVFDRRGVNVARIPNSQPFVGRQASDSLLPALLSQDEAILTATTLEGTNVLTAFSHTAPSGWSVGVGVPEAHLAAPLLRSLRLALGAGLLGLLASLTVAYVLAQRILRPIRALARFAADPSRVAVRRFGMRELDEVGSSLRDSLAARQDAMAALQSLNEGLEARIRQETASRVRAQEQLAHAQRMEALGQLAGGIAHDFNNVLQAVTGGLSLIQRRAADPDAVRRLAGMVSDAAARGASITGRLLTFARRGELDGVAIEPRALLESMREMLAHTLGAGIEVRVDLETQIPNLLADRAQLETVLINLAINARDAMPQGGILAMTATTETAPPYPPNTASLKPGQYVRLSLTDNGHGMTKEVLAHASEPFFTTKPSGQGTGLGLAMARGFAQQSGGGFAIASTEGAGTTVTLWFPQAGTAPEIQPEPPLFQPANGEPAMRLMLVDDDSMVREVLAGELEARGFLVTTASDGLAALALLDTGQPADVLITDYAMPGMDGRTLIEEARKRRPGLPSLLLTGYAEGGVEIAEDRLTLMLRKPIAGEELAQRAAGLRRRAAG